MAKILMGMHNTFRICGDGVEDDDRNAKARPTPFMSALLEKLARKNPQWEFHADGYSNGHDEQTGVYFYTKFKIMNDDGVEELGWINCEHRNAGMSYTFDGPRLRASRTRGWCSATNDVSKATKTIVDKIYGRTLNERMQDAKEAARAAVYSLKSNAGNEVAKHKRVLEGPMHAFALANWDQFSKAVTTPVGVFPNIGAYPDALQTNEDADGMYAAGSSERGYVVVIDGDGAKYHVSQNFNNASGVQTYTQDTVPAEIKASVGMLKLMDVGRSSFGVGIRVKANLFFVVTPEKDGGE